MAKDDEGSERYRREAGEDRYRREPADEPAVVREQKPWRRFWRRDRPAEGSEEVSASSEPRRPTRGGKGAGCVIGFLLVFLLFGLAFAVPFFLLPMWRTFDARTWDAVPCTVERAWVETHSGDDGSTYSIGVVYLYEVGGRRYAGERYDFFIGSTSSREGKTEIVEGLPPGVQTTCWVDPDDPTSAVLSRSLRGDFAFGLLTLPFILFPLVLIVAMLGSRRTKRRRRERRIPKHEGFERSRRREAAEALRTGWLAPTASPLGNLVSTTVVAVLWNSIVAPFVYFVYRDWGEDPELGCVALILVPFAVFGVLFLAGIPYGVLALLNPRPEVALSSPRADPGGTLEVRWRLRGLPGRVRRLKVDLVATGTARTSGPNGSKTSAEEVATVEVVDTRERSEIAGGSRTVQLPPDAPTTSAGVDWQVKLHGEIALWPDVTAAFPLRVGAGEAEPSGRKLFWQKTA